MWGIEQVLHGYQVEKRRKNSHDKFLLGQRVGAFFTTHVHARSALKRARARACVEMEKKYFRLYSSDFMADKDISRVKQIALVLA